MIWILLLALVVAVIATMITMRVYLKTKGGMATVKQFELPEGSDKEFFEDPSTGKKYDKEAYDAYLKKMVQRMTEPQMQNLLRQYGTRADIWNQMMCGALRDEQARRAEAEEQKSIEAEDRLEEINETIAPFFWVEQVGGASVGLETGTYLQDVFATRAAEGFEGNGYDWNSLAEVFLREQAPSLRSKLQFESEAGMFSVYSRDLSALRKFIYAFKEACEDRERIQDLFRQATLE